MTKRRDDKRAAIRFNKVIPVCVSSEEYAELSAVARNISAGGMLIETQAPPPLGSHIRVRFQIPDSEGSITCRAEVKNHYSFNYCAEGQPRWARGMGVRFLEFLADGEDKLARSLSGFRTLH